MKTLDTTKKLTRAQKIALQKLTESHGTCRFYFDYSWESSFGRNAHEQSVSVSVGRKVFQALIDMGYVALSTSGELGYVMSAAR